jgi:predicted TPR repeat methyltransferase
MIGERVQELLGEPMQQAEPETRELTVDEAIQVAIFLQKNDQLVEADAVYRRVLETAPEHPVAVHFSGVLAHQMGRGDEAIALLEKSLRLCDDQADWHSNLGIVLQEQGKLEDAVTAYQRAIALDPTHANAHSNLGVVLRATGKPEEAEAAYRTAIDLQPDHIDAWTNLGVLLNGLKRTEEAVACYCKVITLRPKHREARRLLALAHCTLGEIDEAIKIYREWLAEEPDDAIARHMLAACTGDDIPARASDGFVERTFDSFARSFETKLAMLSYRAPRLLAAMVEDSGLTKDKRLDVLDAGCGTGLCGPLLAPFARTLTGIDLSEAMMAQAREKNVYDQLLKSELTEYMRGRPESFDLIVSADTLCYFGRLDDAFAAAAGALRPGGMLMFTLEHAGDADASPGYHLQRHGRYSHARPYVERLLREAGLEPAMVEADLRMESGVPVAGLVVRGTKAGGGEDDDA